MNDTDIRPRAHNTSLVTAMLWTALLALLSGVALAPFYKATPELAHSSTSTISASAMLGFARDVHHWGSALLIVLGAVNIVVGLFRGAYRKPGQWMWVGSIGLFLSAMLLQLTGHLLPFDAHAVRTTVVETSIAENVPFIGGLQANFVRGGSSVGGPTLRLWYIAHLSLLTLAMVASMALVVSSARKLCLDLNRTIWMAAPLVVVFLLSAISNSPLGPAATALDMASFDARPEWYVLPLHSLLNLSQSLHVPAFVGTMIVPGLAVAFILLLPWLDAKGGPTIAKTAGSSFALGLGALFMMSFGNVAPPIGNQLPPTLPGYLPTPPVLDPKKVEIGRSLFDLQGCRDCHTVAGKGGRIGPDLSQEGAKRNDVDWHIQHLKDPRTVNPGSTMPSFRHLDNQKLEALGQYMSSLNK